MPTQLHVFQLFFLTEDWLLVIGDFQPAFSTLNMKASISPLLLATHFSDCFNWAVIHQREMTVWIIIILLPPNQLKVIVRLEPPMLYFEANATAD